MTDLRVESSTQSSVESARSTEKADYNIMSSIEICFLLNGILEEKSLLSLYPSSSRHSIILSSILAVDPGNDQLILDYGVDEALNQLALRRGRMRCVTTLNQIRMEFDCENLRRIQYEGRYAFSASMPTELKRMQRREFYRIATPVSEPAVCHILLKKTNRNLDDEPVFVAFNLLDISGGGMALLDQPETDTILRTGAVFEQCRIELPKTGEIEATIEIRNICTIILKNGQSCPRIGCEFVDLSETSRALIQRYIIKLEQQKRMLEGKLHF